MATKIGFRCQIDNITHAEIINYLNINRSIMSPKERGVMKEPLLDMVWNEDRDYSACCLDLSDSCVVAQVLGFFLSWFYGISCNFFPSLHYS